MKLLFLLQILFNNYSLNLNNIIVTKDLIQGILKIQVLKKILIILIVLHLLFNYILNFIFIKF